MENSKILKALINVRNNALAKYSNFNVGALIETQSGKIYSGFNIESSSYGLTICAERVAIFKALSEGESEFTKIYLMGPKNEFCYPCGACRQILHDFAPNIDIVLYKENGETLEVNIKELLPAAFNDTSLI